MTLTALMIMVCALPGASLGKPQKPTPSQGKPSDNQVRLFQATLLGGGLALITSAVIFEGDEEVTNTYWLNDGSGEHINLTYQSGANTSKMFWTGAAFVVLAAVLDLVPQGKDIGDEFLVGDVRGEGKGLHLEAAALDRGTSGLALVRSF